jgi:minor extracellular serine protease Vpr
VSFQVVPRRVHRAFAIALIVTLAAWLGGMSPVSAAGGPSTAPTDGTGDNVNAVWTPMGLRSAPTTVVVQLAADPVTVVDANSAAPLSDTEKEQVKGQLKAAQEPVKRQIEALGGTVLGDYQSSYDGIKVQIAANKTRYLAGLQGVVKVHPLQLVTPSNTRGIPYIGAPLAWDGLNGFHGEGIKIGIIDTGIDYTHADFGGPGTVAAWNQAKTFNTADPTLLSVCTTAANTPCFGPAAPKVKGGIDLVGDSYNADPASLTFQPIPHPDPNPLDCFGHGSHVAGTAAGFGVLGNGSTFAGTYDKNTVSGNSWSVGPGVAPKADLYAIRVFGCAGSSNAVIDGIEWAVTHHMDVINMSLGSDFGSADSPDAVAASNAAKSGIIVVSASGNEGKSPYMTSSPGSGTNGIAVAATDSTPSFAGVGLALGTGATVKALNANGATFTDGTFAPLLELKDPAGNLSLGCNLADYMAQGASGKVVITRRGLPCARVARAIFGQQAGAVAVIMVNNASGLPPYEGKITSNPDTGIAYNVSIPFIGADIADRTTLIAAAAAATPTVTLTNASIANPGYTGLASFTSFGPRSGDSALKPDVTAPGVSIASVGMGTGTGAVFESGTSMATPHTAGMAALVKQAHPSWKSVDLWKAAIVSTANPGKVAGYSAAGAGTGLIQAFPATETQVVALGDTGTSALSFGFSELDKNYAQRKQVRLKNLGSSPATFTVSTGFDTGSPHSVVLGSSTVTVPAHSTRSFQVTLAVPVASAGDASAFHDASGVVTFAPADAGQNHGVSLSVPYYLVPKAISHTSVRLSTSQLTENGSAIATLTNRRGAAAGYIDFFNWGLTTSNTDGGNNEGTNNDGANKTKLGSAGLLAAGVQSFPTQRPPSDPTGIRKFGTGWLNFAINTTARWSNPSENEFDILVDVNGDGIPDYNVVVADLGALTTGAFNGVDAVAVFPVTVFNGAVVPTGPGSIRYLAGAPTDGTAMELPVDFSQLSRSGHPAVSSSTPISYTVLSFGLQSGARDSFSTSASFNVFSPVITTANQAFTLNGEGNVVAPNTNATDKVTYDSAQAAKTPILGVMVVSQNNPNRGAAQTQLISISNEG